MKAWGRLLRLSLFPTAAADVLAGLLLARGGTLPGAAATALLLLASLCVFHANLALNDWCDRERDRETRPERPLPSGAISARHALVAIVALCALGILCGLAADPAAGAWMGGVCALAVLYNTRGRGRLTGPLLLGACRAANLALGGAYVGAHEFPPVLWTAPLLYGCYVFSAARLARFEDAEDRDPSGARPRRHLVTAALLLLAVPALPVPSAAALHRLGALALAAAAAAGLFARARAVREWTPAAVGRSVGMALRRMLAFTAAFALLTGTTTGALVALAILAGFPISYVLRGVFPPS